MGPAFEGLKLAFLFVNTLLTHWGQDKMTPFCWWHLVLNKAKPLSESVMIIMMIVYKLYEQLDHFNEYSAWYSQLTPHCSPVNLRYGVCRLWVQSFCFTLVDIIVCPKWCYIKLCHSKTSVLCWPMCWLVSIKSSWLLEMSWHWISARPSATIMLSWLWP